MIYNCHYSKIQGFVHDQLTINEITQLTKPYAKFKGQPCDIYEIIETNQMHENVIIKVLLGIFYTHANMRMGGVSSGHFISAICEIVELLYKRIYELTLKVNNIDDEQTLEYKLLTGQNKDLKMMYEKMEQKINDLVESNKELKTTNELLLTKYEKIEQMINGLIENNKELKTTNELLLQKYENLELKIEIEKMKKKELLETGNDLLKFCSEIKQNQAV